MYPPCKNTLTYKYTYMHTHTHSLSLSLSLHLSHSLSLSLSHTHTHTHIHTQIKIKLTFPITIIKNNTSGYFKPNVFNYNLLLMNDEWSYCMTNSNWVKEHIKITYSDHFQVILVERLEMTNGDVVVDQRLSRVAIANRQNHG